MKTYKFYNWYLEQVYNLIQRHLNELFEDLETELEGYKFKNSLYKDIIEMRYNIAIDVLKRISDDLIRIDKHERKQHKPRTKALETLQKQFNRQNKELDKKERKNIKKRTKLLYDFNKENADKFLDIIKDI